MEVTDYPTVETELVSATEQPVVTTPTPMVLSSHKTLPFGMRPAPVVVKRRSDPIDLGQFNPTYEGWCVVVNLSVELGANDIIASAQDDSIPMKDRLMALRKWLESVLLAWNFVDDNGEPLPQPGDGGGAFCRQELIEPISKAIMQVMSPKKG